MTLAVYTTIASPHVLPFIEEVRRQYPGIEVKYIERGFAGLQPVEKIKVKRGWDAFGRLDYVLRAADDWELTWKILRECDILLCGFREPELFEERVKAGRLTYYFGERWLKPYALVKWSCFSGRFRINLSLPGICRVFVPSFWRMVRRIVRLTDQTGFVFLPIGVFAARDIARLRRFVRGDWLSLFRCPRVNVDRHLFAPVDQCRQIRLWAYFVSPSERTVPSTMSRRNEPISLLWVGRVLDWKRVDTVVRVVRGDNRFRLTILGDGEEKPRLVRLIGNAGNITFHEPTDLPGVRRMMREHDVMVLSSNFREGWGAVVSEAIEEGVTVVGTYEAGSSATVLPESNLFHAGDVNELRSVLLGELTRVDAREWTARAAAEKFIEDWSFRNGE